jgi:hypothetical protein
MEEERKKERKERKKAKARPSQGEKQTKIYTPLSLSLRKPKESLPLSNCLFFTCIPVFLFLFLFLFVN